MLDPRQSYLHCLTFGLLRVSIWLHWSSPVVITTGHHTWLPPIDHHWLPSLVTATCAPGLHHGSPPLITTSGHHHLSPQLITTIARHLWPPRPNTTTGHHHCLPLLTSTATSGFTTGRIHWSSPRASTGHHYWSPQLVTTNRPPLIAATGYRH